MKPKNFPGRRRQRRMAAANREAGHDETGSPANARDVAVPAAVRDIRTKKDGSGGIRLNRPPAD